MSIHEQERNSSLTATVKGEKMMRVLLRARKKAKNAEAGSGKAAEAQRAAGKADRRAKAKFKIQTKV